MRPQAVLYLYLDLFIVLLILSVGSSLAQPLESAKTESIIISVVDYKTPDNSWTVAIQQALDDKRYQQIEIPAGVYLVDALVIRRPLTLALAPGAMLTLAPDSNAILLKIIASDVSVTGGVLDGNAGKQAQKIKQRYSYDGIRILGDRAVIDGVTVRNIAGYGIRGLDSAGSIVRGCRVQSWEGGIYFARPKGQGEVEGPFIENNFVDRTIMTQRAHVASIAVFDNNKSGASYRNSNIISNSVLLPEGEQSEAEGIVLMGKNGLVGGNRVEGGIIGITLKRSNGSRVEGNTFSGNSRYAIEVSMSDGSVITGNRVDGKGRCRIGIGTSSTAPSSQNVLIAENEVGGNRFAIHLLRGSGHRLVGNSISSSSDWGVWLQGSSKSVIENNSFNRTVENDRLETNGIKLEDTADVAIIGNHFGSVYRAIGFFPTFKGAIRNIEMSENIFVLPNSAHVYIPEQLKQNIEGYE